MEELHCGNCPERQKTRCQQRKEEFKKGYAWLETYVKDKCEDCAYTIMKQVNALKILPSRCDRVLEQQNKVMVEALKEMNKLVSFSYNETELNLNSPYGKLVYDIYKTAQRALKEVIE